MNKTIFLLDQLRAAAQDNPSLKAQLLVSRSATDPMSAFCQTANDAGYPVTVGELFAIGLEYSDNQCKSTNGGNPNPFDSFDDAYETFLDSL